MTFEDFIKNVDIDKYYNKSPEERLQFAQEYENLMAELEHRDPCKIIIMDKATAKNNPGLRGYNSGNIICLRPEYFNSRKPKILGLSQYGFANMLETITHEGRHAWQRYVVDHPDKNLVDKKTRLAIQMNLSNEGYRSTNEPGDYLKRYAEYVAQLIEIDARHFTMDWIRYLADQVIENNGRAYAELKTVHDKLFEEEQITAEIILGKCDAVKLQKFEDNLKKKLYPGIYTDGVSMFADALRLLKSKNTLEFVDCRPVETSLDIMTDKADDFNIDLKPDIDRYKPDPFRVSKLKIKKNI